MQKRNLFNYSTSNKKPPAKKRPSAFAVEVYMEDENEFPKCVKETVTTTLRQAEDAFNRYMKKNKHKKQGFIKRLVTDNNGKILREEPVKNYYGLYYNKRQRDLYTTRPSQRFKKGNRGLKLNK